MKGKGFTLDMIPSEKTNKVHLKGVKEQRARLLNDQIAKQLIHEQPLPGQSKFPFNFKRCIYWRDRHFHYEA